MEDINECYALYCKGCDGIDSFVRHREIEEREYIAVTDRYPTVEDSDLHVVTEWVYECLNCGITGSDLEDLLADTNYPESEDDNE